MRNFARFLVMVIGCGLLLNAAHVGAQDATPVPNNSTTVNPTVTCDADLILNLYIAERFFGFMGSVPAAASSGAAGEDANNADSGMGSASASQVVTSPQEGTGASASATLNDSVYYKGQYAPLFEKAMTTTTDTKLTNEQLQNMSDLLNMDSDTLLVQLANLVPSGTDVLETVPLAQANILTEAPACTALRAQLNHFYTAVALQDLGAGGNSANAEATAEATSSANNGS